MNFSDCQLFGVESKKKLSYVLKIPLNDLRDIRKVYKASSYEDNRRIITNPEPRLKKLLNGVNKLLTEIGAPDFEYGGIKKKSFVDNVKVHLNSKYILKTDIQHFFPNTEFAMVYRFFHKRLKMSMDCATIMATITTYPVPTLDENGDVRESIPQGFSTSPLLSMFAYIDLFAEIYAFCKQNNLKFTAYYDDITISSKRLIPKSNLRYVKHVLKKYGFNPHPRKTKLLNINFRKLKVTGVLINQKGIYVPKNFFKKLHDNNELVLKMINNPEAYKTVEKNLAINRLNGIIAAISMISVENNFQVYIDNINSLKKTK